MKDEKGNELTYWGGKPKPMENIIPLTPNYKAVVLPKIATGIIYCTDTDLEYTAKDRSIRYIKDVTAGEIIGLLEETTEEQAKEIVVSGKVYKSHYDYTLYLDYVNDSLHLETALESLKSLISSKGIKTENPLNKPEKLTPTGSRVLNISAKRSYEKKLAAWEASERELKTVLIIKCK